MCLHERLLACHPFFGDRARVTLGSEQFRRCTLTPPAFDLVFRVMTMMGTIEGCVGVLKDCLPKLGEGVSRREGEGVSCREGEGMSDVC